MAKGVGLNVQPEIQLFLIAFFKLHMYRDYLFNNHFIDLTY